MATRKTNLGLVAWAEKILGQPYWYGTCCYPATASLLASKAKQYPDSYKDSRMARYKADIAKGATVSDCVGLVKGFYWTRDDGKQVYGLDGRPDKGANGMFDAAKVKGAIATLPEIPGLLLYSSGHCGVYIGGGWAIEARGFDYGVVRTKVKDRKWTHWYRCPYIEYTEGDEEIPIPEPEGQAERDLFYKSSQTMQHGEDVLALQKRLTELGFPCGTLDGIFGAKTDKAVRAFQEAQGLEVDGVVGSKTREALAFQSEAPTPEEPGENSEDEPAENPAPDGQRLLRYRAGRAMQVGEDVKEVQQQLKRLDYAVGKIDGIFGPKTEQAVLAFQRFAGIVVDGIVGPETRKWLWA